MSNQYLYNEPEESASEHVENDDEETRTVEYLRKRGLKIDEETGEIVEDVQSTRVKVICSCGSYTCCMIVRYGHPLPVFQGDIEPLYPQSVRDVRALELKGGK